MPGVHFSPSALNDPIEAVDFMARDKPLAAARWIDTIEARCALIATAPEMGELRPEFGPQVRSSVVGRYVIFYRPRGEGIEIVRVISGERDVRSL